MKRRTVDEAHLAGMHRYDPRKTCERCRAEGALGRPKPKRPTFTRRQGPERASEDGFKLSRNAIETITDTDRLASVQGMTRIHPDNRYIYDPQPQHLIPEDGAWVMIIRRLPSIERGIDEHISVGRFFYAIRSGDNTDDDGFASNGTYRARLTTPWGEVCVMPYEYAKVETDAILGMWQSGELIFHPVGISLTEFNEQVYYARTRGIPLATAMVMALGSVNANIGWFEPREDLVPDLNDLSEYASREVGRLTDTNHQRRRKARRQKVGT